MTEHFSKLCKNLAFKGCSVIAGMSQGMNVKTGNTFCYTECFFLCISFIRNRKLPRHCYTLQLALVFMSSFTKTEILS